jgi:hypothetical protein
MSIHRQRYGSAYYARLAVFSVDYHQTHPSMAVSMRYACEQLLVADRGLMLPFIGRCACHVSVIRCDVPMERQYLDKRVGTII